MSTVQLESIDPTTPLANAGYVVVDPMMPGAGPVRVTGSSTRANSVFSQIQAALKAGANQMFVESDFDSANALNSEYPDMPDLSRADWNGLVPDAVIGQVYTLGLLVTWQVAGQPDITEMHTESFTAYEATREELGKGESSHILANNCPGMRVADGWWFFDVNVNVPLPGNRLTYPDGSPMRAAIVDCYATDIRWYRSRELNRPIRSPFGNNVVCTDHNRGIRGLLESGIYLRQPAGLSVFSHQHVSSTSENSPTNLALDLTRDIHVIVNAKYSKLYPNLGRAGLMVRVA